MQHQLVYSFGLDAPGPGNHIFVSSCNSGLAGCILQENRKKSKTQFSANLKMIHAQPWYMEPPWWRCGRRARIELYLSFLFFPDVYWCDEKTLNLQWNAQQSISFQYMGTNWATSKQAEMYSSIMCERRGCLVGGLFLWDNRAKEGELMGLHIHPPLHELFRVNIFWCNGEGATHTHTFAWFWANLGQYILQVLTTVVINNCSKIFMIFGRTFFFITGRELWGRRRVFLQSEDIIKSGDFWFLTILK